MAKMKSPFKNKDEAKKHDEYCQIMLDSGFEPACTVEQWLANYRGTQARIAAKQKERSDERRLD